MGQVQHPTVMLSSMDGCAEKDADEDIVRDAERDSSSAKDPQSAPIDTEAQAGVQQVEAITTVWSTTSLVVTYVLIWLVYFIMLTQQVAEGALNPFVTSAFQQHSLTPTVGIISTIIGGTTNLTVAKILDVFGRPHGYAFSLVVATLGLVMMAATANVEMYAAAQVFWTVGTTALLYTVNIFVADTTSLQNRGLMTALTSSSSLITVWLGGPVSQGFLDGPGWRWCFGMFSILVPVLCTPLFVVMIVNSRKAKKRGVIVAKKASRTRWQSVLYYCREFDAFGLFILSAGLAMFLLPFNLYVFQPLGWKSPLIICLLVFGVALMVAFALWEKFFAPVTFIPYELLLDRNMVGACILSAVLFISFYCWNGFFSSFLQVVNALDVTQASYIVQIYSLGGSVFSIICGVVIRQTGRFKAITLYGALPLSLLFMGLMIHFRTPESNIGYIIMCQIFLSFSSGIIIITSGIAAMSATTHQNIAVTLAVLGIFSSIGGAIGLTVAGAIWQGVFPVKLLEYLPAEDQKNFFNIYAALEIQLSYPVGSPTRIAIQHAYADAQSLMLAAGTAVWVPAVVGVAFWRNTDVKTVKQVKGNVI